MANHKASPRFSSEVRERAVRTVLEHRTEHASQWAAIASIAAKIGCTAQTLSNWVRQAERDQGQRPGATTDERKRIKALERENRELPPGQRDPAQGQRAFRPGGVRPPMEAMISFVDAYCDDMAVSTASTWPWARERTTSRPSLDGPQPLPLQDAPDRLDLLDGKRRQVGQRPLPGTLAITHAFPQQIGRSRIAVRDRVDMPDAPKPPFARPQTESRRLIHGYIALRTPRLRHAKGPNPLALHFPEPFMLCGNFGLTPTPSMVMVPPVAPVMVVPARPEVEVDARTVPVPAVVSAAMPAPAMPIATTITTACLLDVSRVLARRDVEPGRHAADGRRLSWHRKEAQRKGTYRGHEPVLEFIGSSFF